ncbi:hypothetical protein O3P69_009101 [Scylla paramamosain]|uniref:Integrase catalytic domain-containing protein n=1 Tax=Scylla paramamosain TaxID=85552 RepID=A0AAW0SAX5_SCYPA
MAGRPRFNTTTSRAPRTPRTPGVPSSHLATTLEMQQALMAMQQALARRSPASRVPTSATPEKYVAQEVVAGAHRHPAPASVRTRPPANRPHTPRREALWQLWRYSRPWESTLPRQVAELLQMWETRTCRENVSQRREEINDPRLGGGCLGPPADVWGRAGGWHRSVPPPDAPRLRHQWGACNVRGDGRGRHRGPAHYPQSNGRAEAAVKSAKRMLRLNIGPTGSLDTDKLSAALLQYHNTPLQR